jgi:plastocyanin
MKTYFAVVLSSLVLLVFTVGCGGGSLDAAPVEPTDRVSVRDDKFTPRVVRVPSGTTVSWRFEGNAPHNVTGDGWASSTQTDGVYERRFAGAGTYDYKCTVHPGMTGRVIVTQ